jgi:hypothetical protein
MKKTIMMMLAATGYACGLYAQSMVADKSIRYQQERMVFKQWDQNKFTPTSGFLGLNLGTGSPGVSFILLITKTTFAR